MDVFNCCRNVAMLILGSSSRSNQLLSQLWLKGVNKNIMFGLSSIVKFTSFFGLSLHSVFFSFDLCPFLLYVTYLAWFLLWKRKGIFRNCETVFDGRRQALLLSIHNSTHIFRPSHTAIIFFGLTHFPSQSVPHQGLKIANLFILTFIHIAHSLC